MSRFCVDALLEIAQAFLGKLEIYLPFSKVQATYVAQNKFLTRMWFQQAKIIVRTMSNSSCSTAAAHIPLAVLHKLRRIE